MLVCVLAVSPACYLRSVSRYSHQSIRFFHHGPFDFLCCDPAWCGTLWVAAVEGDAKPNQQPGSSAAPAARGSPADPLSATPADSVMKKRYSAAQLKREISQPVRRETSQTMAQSRPAEVARQGNAKGL